MTNSATKHVNAAILFLRFFVLHAICLVSAILLSIVSLPLWTALLYRIVGKTSPGQVGWEWYLFVLSPFYIAISTFAILVVYIMWTGAGDRLKSWRTVGTVTACLHLLVLLFVNVIVGGRALP